MVTERETGQDGLPASAPTKCPPKKSTLHCTDDRTASELQLAVKSPRIRVERLWDLCCIGITEHKFTLTEKKTL